MRKQTKLVAALSATALLAIGASAVSFAAGWNNTTGNWQYLDNDGTPIADEWRKSGDYWFYLGSDGNMVTNEVVQKNEDFYYVNQDGAMVTNQWVAFDVESDDTEADHRWMYFGADGKAYRDSTEKLTISDIRTINGKKYLFDAEGYMLYGWLGETATLVTGDDAWKDAKYYYGGFDDGSAQHGWVQLSVVKSDGDEVTAWFHFDDNGKITKNGKKTINGETYYFGQDGRMIEDWSNAKKKTVGSDSIMMPANASSSQIVYVNGDGAARKNQWIWAVPSEDLDREDFENDTYRWWWADSNGKIVKGRSKRIRNKIYAFDKKGRMISGLQFENNGSYKAVESEELAAYINEAKASSDDIYFFSDDYKKDGSRKSGLQTVSFEDGDFQFYFYNNGKAANGYINKLKKFVIKGYVLAANNDDSNYGYVEVSATDSKQLAASATKVMYTDTTPAVPAVLVNNNGTVQKSKFNLKDLNDVYYMTDGNGRILYAGYKKLYTNDSGDHKTLVLTTSDGKKYYTE